MPLITMYKSLKSKVSISFTVLVLSIIFNCYIVHGQCLDIEKHKIDSVDYKNRLKLGFVLHHFIAKKLDSLDKGKENFIKFYAINFYLDSNLNVCNFFASGSINEKMKASLKEALGNSIDSFKNSPKFNLNKLVERVYYLPIIYFNEVNNDKPTVAVLAEKDIGEILNFSSHGPTPFYMLPELIILNPVYYYNSPTRHKGSNWNNKIKFVNKDK